MWIMASCSILMLLVVSTVTGARTASEENELDYGYWNYREGGTVNHLTPLDPA